jgi:hypothetical protein
MNVIDLVLKRKIHMLLLLAGDKISEETKRRIDILYLCPFLDAK